MPSSIQHIPKTEARAAAISLSVGVGLLAVKFIAYYFTQSAVIFSDAVESIANVLAAAVAFYSLYIAHLPADSEHPYGHGKVEFLSASFEGGMILLAAVLIVVRTLEAWWTGHYVEAGKLDLALTLIVIAMLINGAMGFYLIYVGRRQRSMTLEADGRHLMSDAYTSLGVLAALGIVKLTGWRPADPLAALVMAFYIGWMGGRLIGRASAGLMDKQDLEHERLTRDILDRHMGSAGKEPHICSYHKLRHRHSGRYLWVDFHIKVPGQLTVQQGHQIASTIEYEIEQAMGEGNATAHIEPCSDRSCELCRSQGDRAIAHRG